MKTLNYKLLLFYLIGFGISFFLGFKFGFGNSHTAPPTFLFSTLIIFTGIFISIKEILINNYSFKNLKIHLLGLFLNLSLLLYTLYLTLK